MILRYIVETKHRPTFTATKKISSSEEARVICERLRRRNQKEGRSKYNEFLLYSDDNVFIEKL